MCLNLNSMVKYYERQIEYLPSNVFLTLEKWDCNHLTIFLFKGNLKNPQRENQPKLAYRTLQWTRKIKAIERSQFLSHHREPSQASTFAFCNIITKCNCHIVKYTTIYKNKIKTVAYLLPVLPIVKRDQDITRRFESSKQVILYIYFFSFWFPKNKHKSHHHHQIKWTKVRQQPTGT